MAGIQEGPEYGIGDFVLLKNVDIGSFMQNLEHRYKLQSCKVREKFKLSLFVISVNCHTVTVSVTVNHRDRRVKIKNLFKYLNSLDLRLSGLLHMTKSSI